MSMFTSLLLRLFPSQDDKKALILGMGNSGKTTLLYRLLRGEVVTTIPTIGFNVETVRIPDSANRGVWASRNPEVNLLAWDVGGCGRSVFRVLLKHYTSNVSCMLFTIATDEAWLAKEAVEELEIVLGQPGEENCVPPSVPILFIRTKQDLKQEVSAEEIKATFGGLCNRQGRAWRVVSTSLTSPSWRNEQFVEGLEWLAAILTSTEFHPSVASKEKEQKGPTTESASADGRKSLPPKPADASLEQELAEKLASWVIRASDDPPTSEFLKQFETFSLPAWDHYTHIRLAYLILTIHGRQKGVCSFDHTKAYMKEADETIHLPGKNMIFDGIKRYIETSPQTTGRAFHITMTYFWIQIVHFAMQSMPPSYAEVTVEKAGDSTSKKYQDNDEFARLLVINPYLANGNLWADYYSKDAMMTPQAKIGMVLPDKQPLPSLIARDAVRKVDLKERLSH